MIEINTEIKMDESEIETFFRAHQEVELKLKALFNKKAIKDFLKTTSIYLKDIAIDTKYENKIYEKKFEDQATRITKALIVRITLVEVLQGNEIAKKEILDNIVTDDVIIEAIKGLTNIYEDRIYSAHDDIYQSTDYLN